MPITLVMLNDNAFSDWDDYEKWLKKKKKKGKK